MKYFKDAKGNQWELSITVGAIKRVKAMLDVNLLDLEKGEPTLAERLATDIILICDVIYALCFPQAQGRNITDEDFGELLSGDAVLDAHTAFTDEFVNFFLSTGRTDKANVISKTAEVVRQAVTLVSQKIETLDTAPVMNKLSGELSRSMQELLGSTPTLLP